MAQAAAIAREPRRIPVWLLVFLLSVVFHVGGALLIQKLDLLSPKPLPEREDDVVEFVFAPEPAPVPVEQPQRFTELPEDRADEAPERPDMLSNVDSRARDTAPGGESAGAPRSEGIVPEPKVAMAPVESGGSPEAPTPEPEGIGSISRPHPLAAFQGIRPEVEQPPAPEADVSDYEQLSGDAPDGNAALEGAISLSTQFYGSAQWLMAFKRAVQDNWYPPYAFKAGVIHGWTHVELEVARSGELLRAVVQGEQGHGSLREASLAALRAAAPFTALPHDFPDETLVINLRMDYLNPALARAARSNAGAR